MLGSSSGRGQTGQSSYLTGHPLLLDFPGHVGFLSENQEGVDLYLSSHTVMRMLRVGSWTSFHFSILHLIPNSFLTAHHRGSSPTTTLTSGAGQLTSTGKNPVAGEAPVLLLHPCSPLSPISIPLRAPVPAFQFHLLILDPTVLQTSDVQLAAPDPILPASFHSSGRSPEGALPTGVWPCSAQSPCTGGQQIPFSTGSRSCLVRSPGGK